MIDEFVIVCNYIDPPDDSETHRFVSETAARYLLQRLVEIEREVNAGGEWEFILYHKPDDDSLVVLDRFGYVDLLEEEDGHLQETHNPAS